MYKSNGDFVTGEPVSILLYLASLPSLVTTLVLLAPGVLILELSSTTNNVSCESNIFSN